jgi:hypothetical protein
MKQAGIENKNQRRKAGSVQPAHLDVAVNEVVGVHVL